MAAAQLRFGKGFGYQRAATLRGLYEVFAVVANSEAVTPLLSGHEEHSSEFFG